MTIKLNSKTRSVPVEDANLVDLLKTDNLYLQRGIAVAVNDEILPRQSWEKYQVQDNDNILVITATQGG
ncbi:MAG: sulfur carrier protein ThiS [Reichenbachiella sp.]|uniref:sulfur carrier protein ThiS n=1 Tax=Reichenbachiella sp. TaxID=2184521 RepID=UPI003263029C